MEQNLSGISGTAKPAKEESKRSRKKPESGPRKPANRRPKDEQGEGEEAARKRERRPHERRGRERRARERWGPPERGVQDWLGTGGARHTFGGSLIFRVWLGTIRDWQDLSADLLLPRGFCILLSINRYIHSYITLARCRASSRIAKPGGCRWLLDPFQSSDHAPRDPVPFRSIADNRQQETTRN